MAWIELAPRHKYGLPITAPVMPAAGVFGYGDAYTGLVDLEKLGAVVTHPVSLHARHAARGTRVAAHGEHLLVHTGWPNPGLRAVLREHRRSWERMPCPVIVHLLATTFEETGEAARPLSDARNVGGIELGLAAEVTPEDAATLLDAARFEGDLPVIVRVPFGRADELAPMLAEEGADALTLSAPPRAILPLPGADDSGAPLFARGRLYGPALLPLLLEQLARWADALPVPVIACGGIASPVEARACLNLGAAAVQIDALLWRRPALLAEVADALAAQDDDEFTF